MKQNINEMIRRSGEDILSSPNMQSEKNFIQHKDVSCFRHSFSVAYTSVRLAQLLHLKTDTRSMIRGALLHDYFLYDWHNEDGGAHRLHGFSHAGAALRNARRDFSLNATEEDVIEKHMFPLNLTPPHCRESVLVCLADKLCAIGEICRPRRKQ